MRDPEDQAARKVIETPKSPLALYLVIAGIVAFAVWSFQQPSIDVPDESARPRSAQTPASTTSPTGSAKGDLRRLFSADDYPALAQRNGEEGTVQAELAVNGDGRVEKCTVIRSSGSKTLDEATCSILQRRARFTPARDVNGDAVSDTVTTPPVTWRLEG